MIITALYFLVQVTLQAVQRLLSRTFGMDKPSSNSSLLFCGHFHTNAVGIVITPSLFLTYGLNSSSMAICLEEGIHQIRNSKEAMENKSPLFPKITRQFTDNPANESVGSTFSFLCAAFDLP